MKIFPLYIRKEGEEILEKAKAIARREGRPLSNIILELLQSYVKQHGEGNPSFRLDEFLGQKVVVALPTLGHDPYRWNWDNTPLETKKEILKQAKVWLEVADSRVQKEEKGIVDVRCPFCEGPR